MNMWTNYSQGMAAGTAGGFYDLSEHAVVSRLNGQADTALKPGMGVVQGDKPGSNVKIPATGAALEQFEGIVINDVNREMNMDGELLIQPKTTVGVMQYGRIWVRIADGVEPKYGDPVHLIINGTGVGCFKAAAMPANVADCALWPQAWTAFVSGSASGWFAQIRESSSPRIAILGPGFPVSRSV